MAGETKVTEAQASTETPAAAAPEPAGPQATEQPVVKGDAVQPAADATADPAVVPEAGDKPEEEAPAVVNADLVNVSGRDFKEGEPVYWSGDANVPPEALRAGRINTLERLVSIATVQFAAAGVADDRQSLRGAIAGELNAANLTEGAGADGGFLVQLMDLVTKIRELPVPSKDDLAKWIRLATDVTNLWRALFATIKPADQGMNDMLHSLCNSVAGPQILGALARRSEIYGPTAIDETALDTLIDGQQSKELQRMGIEPRQTLPLLNAIVRARKLLQAAAIVPEPGV